MALEMQTHKDIAAFEAKPMFGLTWRRLAALAIMLFGGGGIFFATATIILITSGTSWDAAMASTLQGTDTPASQALTRAATVGMYAMFPLLMPVALWAWLRPMGLRPEEYAQYLFRFQLASKVTHYEDTYAHVTARRSDARAGKPVPDAGAAGGAEQSSRGAVRRLRRSLSEHASESPRGSLGPR